MILGTDASRTANRPASFRWKAFGIHLGISLTILGVLLYILFFHWFPGYLFDTDGGWQALRVIAGVDIILGPLLTLIAANPSKSAAELRKDFAVIGVIQACALSAGTWLAFDNRPYALFWYDGIVYSLPWSALREEPEALEALQRLSPDTPHRVVVDMPFDPVARSAVIRAAAEVKKTPLFDARRFRAWPAEARLLRAFTEIGLGMASEGDRARLEAAHAEARKSMPAAELVAVRSRYKTYFLPVDPATGATGEAIRVSPNEKLLEGQYSLKRLHGLLAPPATSPE